MTIQLNRKSYSRSITTQRRTILIRRIRSTLQTVLTEHYKWVLNIENVDSPQALLEEPALHYFDEVPVIEYLNNKLAIGDFELQIPLIDNALMSEWITDKGAVYRCDSCYLWGHAGDPDAKDEDGKTGKGTVKDDKLLELPKDSKAEYLTRTFDEQGVEVLEESD